MDQQAAAEEFKRRKASNTALLRAAAAGNLAAVEGLIAEGASVDTTDDNGLTPLHLAAAGGRDAVARLLLSKGASVQVDDNAGRTPLHAAARFGQAGIIELLLARGADPAAADSRGRNPLHTACSRAHDAAAKSLAGAGPDGLRALRALNDDGVTPLCEAALRGAHGCARACISVEPTAALAACRGLTALHAACSRGDAEMVQILLLGGADARAGAGPSAVSSLHVAAHQGSVECCQALLAAGADPGVISADGDRPKDVVPPSCAHADALRKLLDPPPSKPGKVNHTPPKRAGRPAADAVRGEAGITVRVETAGENGGAPTVEETTEQVRLSLPASAMAPDAGAAEGLPQVPADAAEVQELRRQVEEARGGRPHAPHDPADDPVHPSVRQALESAGGKIGVRRRSRKHADQGPEIRPVPRPATPPADAPGNGQHPDSGDKAASEGGVLREDGGRVIDAAAAAADDDDDDDLPAWMTAVWKATKVLRRRVTGRLMVVCCVILFMAAYRAVRRRLYGAGLERYGEEGGMTVEDWRGLVGLERVQGEAGGQGRGEL
ncbi:unnamed protein product [Pedinophyceae sp. YPF-701]|nr:unnamed protein product [Pedinophyceae sp. YPF-701]